MADKNFVNTPAQCPADPTTKGGPGEYDGEKNYPPRTSSPNGVPEKVRDNVDFSEPDSSTGTFVSTPAKPPYGK